MCKNDRAEELAEKSSNSVFLDRIIIVLRCSIEVLAKQFMPKTSIDKFIGHIRSRQLVTFCPLTFTPDQASLCSVM